MSLTKRYLEDVAEELGKEDIMDPAVVAEATRRCGLLWEVARDFQGSYTTLEGCMASGQHLTNCDEDGYCNFCGEQ